MRKLKRQNKTRTSLNVKTNLKAGVRYDLDEYILGRHAR
jgi:hypothetical protein